MNVALLRLMQLSSPSLPVGAFAYSQGLEYAVHCGWVHDKNSAAEWLCGLMNNNMAFLEVPIAKRQYLAQQGNDLATFNDWNELLMASRESAQVQAQEKHLAAALGKVLQGLEVLPANWRSDSSQTFSGLFMLAAVRWQAPLNDALQCLLWSWLENLTLAAVKLIPLGHSDGQRLLYDSAQSIVDCVQHGLQLNDEDIGAMAPAASAAMALHETLYSRLFRS